MGGRAAQCARRARLSEAGSPPLGRGRRRSRVRSAPETDPETFPNAEPDSQTEPLPAASPSSDRRDSWTTDRQRSFLESLAEGHSVERACRIVGMTHQSAYNLRRRASGAAFALGREAALLLARQRLADTLMVRAIEGQTESITRANGDVVERTATTTASPPRC